MKMRLLKTLYFIHCDQMLSYILPYSFKRCYRSIRCLYLGRSEADRNVVECFCILPMGLPFFEILSSSCFVHGTSGTCFILESFVTHNSMNDKCCLGEKDVCKLNA